MKILRILALVFAWIGATDTAFTNPVKIGVLLKGKSDFWAAMEKGAREAAAKAGAEIIVKAPMNETDVAVQLRLLSAITDENIQALVIAPCGDELSQPLAALTAKGVKIVVIDSLLAAHPGYVFVGTDQRAAGEAAGGLLAGLANEGDEVAFLRNTQIAGAASIRESGALSKLMAAHPKIIVHGDIYASTEAGMEEDRSQLLLTKYPQVKAIFASGSPGTMAMLKVLSAKKTNGSIKLVGFGFNLNPTVVAGLQDGTITAWIAQLPKDMGRKGVESALALVSGTPTPPVISTDFLVITKANLSAPRVQSLLSL